MRERKAHVGSALKIGPALAGSIQLRTVLS